MVFSHLVEHIVMPDARDEQLWPVTEKNARSDFFQSDSPHVFFQQRSVAPGLRGSPR